MKHDQEHYEQLYLSARRMRANPTQAEDAIWWALRDRKLAGLKFRRQNVIGPFIADFYCASVRLVIEIDGDVHDYQKEYDEARTKQLDDHGYCVIRFRNERVFDDTDFVLAEIKNVSFNRMKDLTPSPSPDSRGGEKDLSHDAGGWEMDLTTVAGGGEKDLTPDSGG
jgi:very-short-patch-repair endonuclease